jgi:hypothetical protein
MTKKGINRVTISIPEKLDLKFRQKACTKFKFKRGWYGLAFMEGMRLWLNKEIQLKQIKESKRDFSLLSSIPLTNENEIEQVI